ncbi:MAG: hypothetical protein ACOX13_08445 [Bacillota bacterium]
MHHVFRKIRGRPRLAGHTIKQYTTSAPCITKRQELNNPTGDDMLRDTLMDIYNLLYERFGAQNWWPAKTGFEVIVGAILTQATSWRNVEKAIANLKDAGVLSLDGLLEDPCPCAWLSLSARPATTMRRPGS